MLPSSLLLGAASLVASTSCVDSFVQPAGPTLLRASSQSSSMHTRLRHRLRERHSPLQRIEQRVIAQQSLAQGLNSTSTLLQGPLLSGALSGVRDTVAAELTSRVNDAMLHGAHEHHQPLGWCLRLLVTDLGASLLAPPPLGQNEDYPVDRPRESPGSWRNFLVKPARPTPLAPELHEQLSIEPRVPLKAPDDSNDQRFKQLAQFSIKLSASLISHSVLATITHSLSDDLLTWVAAVSPWK